MNPVDTKTVNLLAEAMKATATYYQRLPGNVQVSRVLTVNGVQIRVTVEREADAVRRRLEDLTSDRSYDA